LRKLFHDDDTIPASVSPFGNLILCRHPKKVADVINAAATSFFKIAMERPKPIYLIAIAKEEMRKQIFHNAKCGMEKL
jgi:hypothetical protein